MTRATVNAIHIGNTRGKVAKNAAIERNVNLICEFDRRFMEALQAHDAGAMRDLAVWADGVGLTAGQERAAGGGGDGMSEIICGDALAELAKLDAGIVQTCVTILL